MFREQIFKIPHFWKLVIDPDGLTLGDKHPGPDLRHYLSTYNKEENEQTNNISKCFKSSSNKKNLDLFFIVVIIPVVLVALADIFYHE